MRTFQYVTRASILIILSAFLSLQGNSQVTIKVEQVKETMSKGEQAGYEVVIPQANMENVKKAWIKQIQQGVKSKVIESGFEVNLEGASAPEISPDPINIYSLLTDVDSIIHLVAFFEIDSVFFDKDTYPDKLVKDKINNGIQNYLRRFAVQQYQFAVENELKTEESKLSELEKQLEDLKKAEEKMEKSIKEEEQNITEADDEINMLNAQKEQQMQLVETKRVSNVTITDKEAKKVANDELKALEKEKDKTDKELEKMEKEKVSAKNKIEDYEKGIEQSQEDQQELELQIEQQEEVIEQVTKKLAGIK